MLEKTFKAIVQPFLTIQWRNLQFHPNVWTILLLNEKTQIKQLPMIQIYNTTSRWIERKTWTFLCDISRWFFATFWFHGPGSDDWWGFWRLHFGCCLHYRPWTARDGSGFVGENSVLEQAPGMRDRSRYCSHKQWCICLYIWMLHVVWLLYVSTIKSMKYQQPPKTKNIFLRYTNDTQTFQYMWRYMMMHASHHWLGRCTSPADQNKHEIASTDI